MTQKVRLRKSDALLAQTWRRVCRNGGTVADVAREVQRSETAVRARASVLRYFGVELPHFPRGIRPKKKAAV